MMIDTNDKDFQYAIRRSRGYIHGATSQLETMAKAMELLGLHTAAMSLREDILPGLDIANGLLETYGSVLNPINQEASHDNR